MVVRVIEGVGEYWSGGGRRVRVEEVVKVEERVVEYWS